MLTPLDIENVKFRGALSGYDRGEVEQFRARMIQALEEYIAQVETLRERIAELETQLSRYHDSEELLKNSVVLAQRTADELIAAAHQRADVIVQAAQLEGEGVRQSLGELRAEREQFEYQFHGLLTGFIRHLEQGNPALAPAPAPPAYPAPAAPLETRAPAFLAQPAAQSKAAPASAPQQAPRIPAASPAPPPPAPRPTAAAQIPRDEDVSSLTALLDAVQPAPEPELIPPAAPAIPPPGASLQEPFAPAGEADAQDQP